MNKLILVAGPSGVGKSTIVQELLRREPSLARVISCTTRAPRTTETHGIDYNFMSVLDFETAVKCGQFLEHARVHNHYYGTERSAVMRIFELDRTPLLITDVQGFETLRLSDIPIMSVFIRPTEPWRAEIYCRMKSRGDSQEQIETRMAQAETEMRMAERFHLQVTNWTLDRTVETLQYVLGSRS